MEEWSSGHKLFTGWKVHRLYRHQENGNLRDFGEPLVPWEQPQTAMLWQRIICVRGVEREVESKWSKEHACGTFVIIFDHHS